MAYIHPDNTALRAIDACGGTYSAEEEASGFADGHRTAMRAALLATHPVDNLMSDLFEALLTKRDYVMDVIDGHLTGKSDIRDMARDDLARIDAAIRKATAAAV